MNNQEFFIVILIGVLIVLKFIGCKEGFEINDYPCATHPTNSNCTCPPEAPVQTIIGQFPMNYGENSPYVYTCVPKSGQEPSTNVFPNPPL